MHVIGFVPARGGSQRIPRKNLRTVHGVPLVARTICTLRAAGVERVIVSTDDHEIADVAVLWGAEVDVRPPKLAGPDATIAELVDEWVDRVFPPGGREVMIAVAQPTSPLLSPNTVAAAICHAAATGSTIFTVTPERHMLWDDRGSLLNRERVNSTTASEPSLYRETGALVVFNAEHRVKGGTWPPGPVEMCVLDTQAEAIDIDDYGDLVRARAGSAPAHIQFRYAESLEIGSGHRRRCETLAIELAGHHSVAVVDDAKVPLTDDSKPWPDVVVFDVLDVPGSCIEKVRAEGVKHVVTLEDLGSGEPDLRINELYAQPPDKWLDTEHFGPRFAVLRPEFQGHGFSVRPPKDGFTVVVTFGGTDPTDATAQVVEALMPLQQITSLRVIVPPAHDHATFVLPKPERTNLVVDALAHPCMAAEFLNAHLVVSSSGRTVHEAAACGVPVIACAVNERERMHSVCPGVTYLDSVDGIGLLVEGALLEYWQPGGPAELAKVAHAAVDGNGALRIAWLIDGLLGGLL